MPTTPNKKPTNTDLLTGIQDSIDALTADVGECPDRIKKLHEKVDNLVSSPSSSRTQRPTYEYAGDVPADYTGAIGVFLIDKDENGKKVGHTAFVPTQLLNGQATFDYVEEDATTIVPMKIKDGGIH